jgi:hypothetical protein
MHVLVVKKPFNRSCVCLTHVCTVFHNSCQGAAAVGGQEKEEERRRRGWEKGQKEEIKLPLSVVEFVLKVGCESNGRRD